MRMAWLLVLAACGKGGGGGLPGGGGSGSAQVAYQPAAKVLERDEGRKAIVGVSHDGWTLVFDASNPKLAGLKAGDIVIIKGLVARKVMGVQAMPNNEIGAFTQSATLGEALQNGSARLQAGIRFKTKHASSGWLENT